MMDKQPLLCQIQTLPHIAEPASLTDLPGHFLRRLKRFVRRRIAYVFQFISDHLRRRESGDLAAAANQSILQPGDRVRVKSREAISETTNNWNCLNGCCYMEEMGIFCGTEQIVLKRVERFLDERDYQIKKCHGLVILKDAQCWGTVDFGRCDRSCYFFWREEWLEKIN